LEWSSIHSGGARAARLRLPVGQNSPARAAHRRGTGGNRSDDSSWMLRTNHARRQRKSLWRSSIV